MGDEEFAYCDPVRKIFMDRSYLIHKRKVEKAEKRVDTSSPFSLLPKLKDNWKGKCMDKDKEIRTKNSMMYKKLRGIYKRETRYTYKEIGARSSNGSITRKLELVRIANENEAMINKLSQSKSSYLMKEFEAKFKEAKVFAEKLSKVNRMLTCKKFINNLISRP